MKIGFIGLGTMGGPMAANLLKNGYTVVAYNRSPEKALALGELGAEVAVSPAETVSLADVVFTMVSHDEALEDIYFGDKGILGAVRPGMVFFDCSTVSPELSLRVHEELSGRDSEFFDAPVTGSKPAAVEGKLVFMVGGDKEKLEQFRDILLAMGSGYRHMGPHGAGLRTKLAINTIAGVNMAAFVEGLSMAAKAGVDLESFILLSQAGGSASRMAELKREKLLDRDYAVQFELNLMLKDLRLAISQAAALGVPSPLLQTAESLYSLGADKGLGKLDLSAIVQLYEEWADTSIARGTPAPQHKKADSPRTAINRRRSIRVPLNIKLQISIYQWVREGSFSGQSVEASLQDLSEDGMRIECDLPLAPEMFIVIHFPQDAQLPPITGKIIRIDRKKETFHYGCLLSGMAPYTRIQLESYIRGKLDQRSS